MSEIETLTAPNSRRISILNSLKIPSFIRGKSENITNSTENIKDNAEIEPPEAATVVMVDESSDDIRESRISMAFGNLSLPSFRSSKSTKSPTPTTPVSSSELISERNSMMLANPITLLNLAHDVLKKSTSTKNIDAELSFENFENYYACEAYGARTPPPRSSAKC